MFSEVDWESLYVELAGSLPGDPRFSYHEFYNYTPINQIFEVLDRVRKNRFERLHQESIPVSILTSQFTKANVSKNANEISPEDFQPFKSIVDAKPKPQFDKAAASTLIELHAVGLLPLWAASLIEYESVKNSADDFERWPYMWSNRDMCLVHPTFTKDSVKAKLAFYNMPRSPIQTLNRLHGNFNHDYRIPVATVKIDDSLMDCLETEAELELLTRHIEDYWDE